MMRSLVSITCATMLVASVGALTDIHAKEPEKGGATKTSNPCRKQIRSKSP